MDDHHSNKRLKSSSGAPIKLSSTNSATLKAYQPPTAPIVSATTSAGRSNAAYGYVMASLMTSVRLHERNGRWKHLKLPDMRCTFHRSTWNSARLSRLCHHTLKLQTRLLLSAVRDQSHACLTSHSHISYLRNSHPSPLPKPLHQYKN